MAVVRMKYRKQAVLPDMTNELGSFLSSALIAILVAPYVFFTLESSFIPLKKVKV
jgi:hypothetical protein